MSLLDEHNDARASIECARKAIECIYEGADRQYSIIYDQLRELLNQDPEGAYYYMMLITTNDELKDQFYENTGIKPLPLSHKQLTKRVDELDRLNIAKTKMFNDEHIRYLVLKNCILRFMKYHPTWKLGDDERRLIFGEKN